MTSRLYFVAVMLAARSLAHGVSVVAGGTQAPASTDWEAADKQTARLAPSAFPALYERREELSRRGCGIPQSFLLSGPHNVIVGAFTGSERTDIAILCSANGGSSILVFRRGSAAPVAELGRQPDRNYLEVIDGRGTIAFGRVIMPVDANTVRRYTEGRGDVTPAYVHAGIADAFVGKGSVVWYWDGRRWVEIPGAN
jgi:hypothetical protein